MNYSTNSTIILGGGFTGLFTALHLQRIDYSRPVALIDRAERFVFKPLLLLVAPTLQLPHFPEVFAGGDCAADLQHPLPPTAQVAYQQGAAIASNLQALAEGKRPTHAEIDLRGSLLKLGLDAGAANLFDQFVITGKSAHLIRQGTYLTLLPTPVHDFRATTEWLSEEIFQNYLQPK